MWRIIRDTNQMLIGVGVFFIVIFRLAHDLNLWSHPAFCIIYQTKLLTIIGDALLYSSAIELAYTLFTPGPDEAVEPLITGLAAVILIGIAQIDYDKVILTDEIMRNIAVFVIILVVFFIIRKYLLKEKQ